MQGGFNHNKLAGMGQLCLSVLQGILYFKCDAT